MDNLFLQFDKTIASFPVEDQRKRRRVQSEELDQDQPEAVLSAPSLNKKIESGARQTNLENQKSEGEGNPESKLNSGDQDSEKSEPEGEPTEESVQESSEKPDLSRLSDSEEGFSFSEEDVYSTQPITSKEQLCKMFSNSTDICCILDHNGCIIYTNESWNQFCADNGGDVSSNYLGADYLRICESIQPGAEEYATAQKFTTGLRRILEGSAFEEFQLEYPCDSPTLSRLYLVKVNGFKVGKSLYVVVLHHLLSVAPKTSYDAPHHK